MQRLEAKKIKGHTYYYFSNWGWKNGKCRRLSQQYLGKAQDIAQAFQGGAPTPLYARVLAWGLPQALWQEAKRAQVTQHVDLLCPKRVQGLSTGDYIVLAAMNRADNPVSKRAMADWFSSTSLSRVWPEVCPEHLSSQHFWDHMDRIELLTAQSIWQQLISQVLEREKIDLSQICYDGTNFYTFIDTFNLACPVAQRGKNKQGRCNLRQVNYALFCSNDGHLPLFYDVYEGNRNDAKEFPQVLEKFEQWLLKQGALAGKAIKPTLIFDKGNNSRVNFELIDKLDLPYVGSVKLGEHAELMGVSNSRDPRWQNATQPGLEGTKSWRDYRMVYGKERTLVVTYNENLFESQWATVQNDLTHALSKLACLQQNLLNRASGLLKGGVKPSTTSVKLKCDQILARQHLRQLVETTILCTSDGAIQLAYQADPKALQKLADTYLGKTVLLTSHKEWSDEQVIRAYRSQFVIEEIFHEMKGRHIGTWWPLHHWTESKIHVHGLYCTIAMLLRALLWRRVSQAGLHLSMAGMLEKLRRIEQVINAYPAKGSSKLVLEQSVLTKRDETQEKLIEVLGLPVPK